MIRLSAVDLAVAALLVLVLAVLGARVQRSLGSRILVAALRTTVQLLLIGLILKALFAHVHLLWMALLSMVMLLVAGREVTARQQRRFAGWWGFGMGTVSMFLSSFAVTIFALVVIIGNQPWYAPQYAIPLLGMLLGNTMNGISIAMDRLTETAWQQRGQIEARLMLGHSWEQASGALRRDAVRGGLIPIINAMSAAGLVSLPGMMTGQILAGSPPVEAVKYQILIMFLIAVGTGLGTLAAVWAASRRLFDERQRLRLDRLRAPPAER
ncbi:MAG TPA: iron export ABC transporter permease subunit FetB [Gammaproteobacteria bacterium]|nr:iron export ABC transporter permease subunit FetB [Gammaproteobacteria bacterium]